MELERNPQKASGPEALSQRPSKAILATLFSLALLVASWTAYQWSARIDVTQALKRDVLWSLKTPSAPAPSSFLRIEGTSFWTGRFSGLVTSPTFLATTTHVARLQAPIAGGTDLNRGQVLVAPDSQVWVDRQHVKLQRGLIEVRGPIKIESTPKSSPANTSKSVIALWESSNTGNEADPILFLEPMEPKLGSIHELNSSQHVSVSWSVGGVSKIEFARDSRFETVLFSVPNESEGSRGGTVKVDFSDRALGAWFVRLRSSDQTLGATAFSLVESQTPDHIRPMGRRWLSWRDRGEAVYYRVEFSPDETFKKIDQTFQVPTREMDLTLVTPGAQFARVTAVDMNEQEFAARPIALKVAEKAEILRASTDLTDPELKLLARGWKIVLNDDEVSRLRENYVILRESELRGIRIADTAPASLRQVIFEVSRDENFSNPERVKPDSRGELLPPALPLGVIYARLRRIEADGSLGAVGPASRLTTLLPAPKPVPSGAIQWHQSQESLRGIEAKWTYKAQASGFEIKFSTDKEFSPSQTSTVRTESFSKSIPAEPNSTIFWNVTALDRFGNPISATSSTQIKKTPRPAPSRILSVDLTSKDKASRRPAAIEPLVPQLTSPAEDAVIVGGARAVTYGTLRWEFRRQKPDERFEVQIATDADFVNIVEKRKQKSRDFTLRGDLPEGALFWRVRRESSKQWSEARRFDLVYE